MRLFRSGYRHGASYMPINLCVMEFNGLRLPANRQKRLEDLQRGGIYSRKESLSNLQKAENSVSLIQRQKLSNIMLVNIGRFIYK